MKFKSDTQKMYIDPQCNCTVNLVIEIGKQPFVLKALQYFTFQQKDRMPVLNKNKPIQDNCFLDIKYLLRICSINIHIEYGFGNWSRLQCNHYRAHFCISTFGYLKKRDDNIIDII